MTDASTLVTASPTLRPDGTSMLRLDLISWCLGGTALACFLAAYLYSSLWLMALAAGPVIILTLRSPGAAVALLTITIATFPVLILNQDLLDAKTFSTKGPFLAADDLFIGALAITALLRVRRTAPFRAFPGALFALALYYPAVIAVNTFRLEPSESVLSVLYYLKWLEYAAILWIVPRLLTGRAALSAASRALRLLIVVAGACSAFAVYEFVEAVRTGSYTKASSIPRVSAFFGTLDPRNFGASEDPVNFGVFMVVVILVLFAAMTRGASSGRTKLLLATVASVTAMLLTTSRTPIIALAVGYAVIGGLRSARILFGTVTLIVFLAGVFYFFPSLWTTTTERFAAIAQGDMASERSAVDRAAIIADSPVFEVDSCWLSGHGFSSFRFIVADRRGQVTNGFSRSLYNFLLTAWYDAGPVGLTLWILAFVQLSRRFKAISLNCLHTDTRDLAVGLRGALWAIAAASMFAEFPYGWRLMGFFYLLVSVCLAAAHAEEQAGAGGLAPQPL